MPGICSVSNITGTQRAVKEKSPKNCSNMNPKPRSTILSRLPKICLENLCWATCPGNSHCQFSGFLFTFIFCEFCLLKILTSYQKLLWNVRSRLNSSTFWVFEPEFRYIWSKLKLFAQKNEYFYQTSLNTGSKTQNVEKLSLDLTFHNNFW